MHRSIRQFTLCGLVSLSMLLSACSLAGYGYELAPWWINRQISGYVTFSASQQEMVDKNLATLHEWHRATQLPVYVAFLEQVSDRWSSDSDRPNGDQLDAWRERLLTAWRDLARQMAPALAQVLVTLTPTQLDQIETAINDQASKGHHSVQAGKSSTEQEKYRARVDRWVERGESFFGDLTELQQARLSHRVKDAPPVSAWWLERALHRRKLIQLFRELANEKPAADIATQRVYQSLINYGKPFTKESQRLHDRTQAASRAATVGLFETVNTEQIQFLKTKLSRYVSILRGVKGFEPLSD